MVALRIGMTELDGLNALEDNAADERICVEGSNDDRAAVIMSVIRNATFG